MPRPGGVQQHDYREARLRYLEELCLAAKNARPDALDIVGIAVGPSVKELSEDLVYLDARHWSDELNARAAEIQARTGAFIGEPNVHPPVLAFPRISNDD